MYRKNKQASPSRVCFHGADQPWNDQNKIKSDTVHSNVVRVLIKEWRRINAKTSGTTLVKKVSVSCLTSESQFSFIVREALVWCTEKEKVNRFISRNRRHIFQSWNHKSKIDRSFMAYRKDVRDHIWNLTNHAQSPWQSDRKKLMEQHEL